MTDPNPIVECIGPNGEKLYRRRSSAKAWGFKITDRPATDGHGYPKRDKPKTALAVSPTQKAAPATNPPKKETGE